MKTACYSCRSMCCDSLISLSPSLQTPPWWLDRNLGGKGNLAGNTGKLCTLMQCVQKVRSGNSGYKSLWFRLESIL